MADSYIVEIAVVGGKMSVRQLDTVDKSIAGIGKTSAKTTGDLSNLTRGMKTATAGLGLVAVAVGAVAIKLTGLASDLEETQSKFNTVFKVLAGTANEWAEDFGNSVGRAEVDVKRWMAGLQDTFVPLGIAREEAFELSKSLTTLAVDVASFNNAADDETINLFTSALVGNHEAVRRFGIQITESELKLEALRQGLKGNVADLSAVQKMQLRYNLILRGTTDAQGDALRTADSYANQVKRLQANLKNVATEMGIRLLPAMTQVVTATNEWTRANERLISSGADIISWIVGGEIDGVTKEIRDLTAEIERLRDQRNEGILGFLLRDTGPNGAGLGGPGGAGLDVIIEAMEMRRRALEAAAREGGRNILGEPTAPTALATIEVPPGGAAFGGRLVGTGGQISGLRGMPEEGPGPLSGFELLAQVPEITRVTTEAFEEMESAVIPILQREAAEVDIFNEKLMRTQDTAFMVSDAIVDAFVGVALGTKSAGDAMVGFAASAAGQVATYWGNVHVAMGAAEMFAPGMQGFAAKHIASGVALQILGGVLGGLAGGAGGSRGAGGGGGSAFGSGVSTPGGGSNRGGDSVAPTVIIIGADGSRSVGTGSQGRRMLNDSVDNRQLGYALAEMRRTGAVLD